MGEGYSFSFFEEGQIMSYSLGGMSIRNGLSA